MAKAVRDRAAADLSLFITTQIEGVTEPCGCSSEPLGDVARIAGLLKTAGPRGLLIDAGGLRYKPLAGPSEKQQQARLKADFLEQTWQKLGAVTMLQPGDLMGAEGGAELARSVRLCSNLLGAPGVPAAVLQSEEVRTVSGVKLGIMGIAAPSAGGSWPAGVFMSEPIAAAEQAVARLRAKGAAAVIALTGLRRDGARRLAKKVAGIDLVVAGADPELSNGAAQAEQVDAALLVVPAVEGRRLVRVDLYLPSASKPPVPVWALRRTPEQLTHAIAALRQQLATTKARLAAMRQDASAEPAFVKTTADEVARLAAELARLEKTTLAPDGGAGHVTIELVAIGRQLPRSTEVADAMLALDHRIGEANLAALSGPPPSPPAGAASYVGLAACQGSCHFHDDAVDFWQKTRHAQAFSTLVKVGKDLSYDCVQCHVVGFDEAGGANLWSLAAAQRGTAPAGGNRAVTDLRDVQCEVCHGPGSLHVRAPSTQPIPFARPTVQRCLTCHTKDHSDTFAFDPYLRDILGPGHGAERRAALGNGVTGHELRAAALKTH